MAWIASGVQIFRTAKPDVPPKHLVAYFALVDPAPRSMLLVDHRNAGLWLPTGGHVEPDEDLAATVTREAREELGHRRGAARRPHQQPAVRDRDRDGRRRRAATPT